MNKESTIIQFPQPPSEEERIPVPWSFVDQARQSHQQMLLHTESIKEDAIRKGNTMLAVKATDMIKASQQASSSFENLVANCFEVISDRKYKKLYPEEYSRLMEEKDDDLYL